MDVTPSNRIVASLGRQARRAWTPLLGLALLWWGCAEPQSEPAPQEPAAAATVQPAPQAPAPSSEKQVAEKPEPPKPTALVREPAGKDTGCGADSKEAKLPPLKPDPTQTGTPRFVCAQPVVKIDPVWAGKPLTFKFSIANKGTADLILKIKGG